MVLGDMLDKAAQLPGDLLNRPVFPLWGLQLGRLLNIWRGRLNRRRGSLNRCRGGLNRCRGALGNCQGARRRLWRRGLGRGLRKRRLLQAEMKRMRVSDDWRAIPKSDTDLGDP